LNFDFTEIVFDGGDFPGAKFSSGRVNFDHAESPVTSSTSATPSSPAAG